MAKKNKTTPVAEPMRFTKQAFIDSKEYRHRGDLLRALLRDGETYTPEEVQQLLDRHLKRKVN